MYVVISRTACRTKTQHNDGNKSFEGAEQFRYLGKMLTNQKSLKILQAD